MHRRVGLFREVDLHPGDQPPADDVFLLHDPGQRQGGDVLVLRPLGVALGVALAVPQEAAMRQHRQLRIGGGARGRAQDGDVVGLHVVDHAVVARAVALVRRRAQRLQIRQKHEARVVVLPHAARIAVDDLLDRGHPVLEIEELVDLLLVLGDHDAAARVIDEIGDLALQRVAVDAEAHRADGVRGDLAADPLRAVVADQRDHVALAEAEFRQAERDVAHMRVVVGPAIGLPDAELLLAHGDVVAVGGGMAAQDGRRRRVPLQVGQMRLRTGIGIAGGGALGAHRHITPQAAAPPPAASSCSSPR